MAAVTRKEAIAQIQKVLKAYAERIHEIRHDTAYLVPAGKEIVDAYCCNEENVQVLVKTAYRDTKFFDGMSDSVLIQYAQVCGELNDILCLGVKELVSVTAIADDEESIWETVWGALQGEFNEDPSGLSILIDMGLNFIPVVGQVLDARDIIACLDKLIRQRRYEEIGIWIALILTAIGCIPYAGDVIKAIGKAIIKEADDIVLMLLKKLDAEDVYKAFSKFYEILQESAEEAAKLVDRWVKEAAEKYRESDAAELLSKAHEYINRAFAVIQTKIDEFAERVFRKTKADKAQIEAVSGVKNPNTELVNPNHPHDHTMKGNYGEMKVDIDLEKDGKYQRVSNFRVTSLTEKGHHGIDGIYRNMNAPPDFIIVDAKYLGAEEAVEETFAPRMPKRKDGIRQMDIDWIEDNLKDSISDEALLKEIQSSIRNGRVDSVAAKIDNRGEITYYQLDQHGNIMTDTGTNKPKIYNIH